MESEFDSQSMLEFTPTPQWPELRWRPSSLLCNEYKSFSQEVKQSWRQSDHLPTSALRLSTVDEWDNGTTHLFGCAVATYIDGGSYYSPPVVDQTRQQKLNYVELYLHYPIRLNGVMLK
jgi:hypothetical protein